MAINIYLLFQSVKIVYDDTNEKIEGEERTTDYEDNKVEIIIERGFVLRLLVNFCGINSVSHDFHPSFESCLERYILYVNIVNC